MVKRVDESVLILENKKVGPRLYCMTLSAPLIAHHIRPGQFVHMRIPAMDDHILRRPFSVYACDVCAGTLDILYQIVGFGSDRMASLKSGEALSMIGPIGRGWSPASSVKKSLLVAGGVGAAPLYMLAESLIEGEGEVDVVLGAQTLDALVCRSRYEKLLGTSLLCATDDGSFGRAGFCTSLVKEALEAACEHNAGYDYVAVCGPEPLMRLVAGYAQERDIVCEVSLERRMACGIGACLSCVVDTCDGKKRACVDGPVFDAQKVVW